MKITLQITQQQIDALGDHLEKRIEEARLAAQEAGANAIYDMIQSNIGGEHGEHRPAPWPPLSPAYAKKVGRTYATLRVSGLLQSMIKVTHLHDASVVSIDNADVPYALAHQFGAGNLPARPYFPLMAGGDLEAHSDYENSAYWAARNAFQEALAT